MDQDEEEDQQRFDYCVDSECDRDFYHLPEEEDDYDDEVEEEEDEDEVYQPSVKTQRQPPRKTKRSTPHSRTPKKAPAKGKKPLSKQPQTGKRKRKRGRHEQENESEVDQYIHQDFKLSDYIADLLSEDYQFIDKTTGKKIQANLLNLRQKSSDENYYSGPSPLAWNSIEPLPTSDDTNDEV